MLKATQGIRSLCYANFTISQKVGAIFLLILVIAVANLLVMHATLRNLNGFAETVNVAGRLRMLSQKIAFETIKGEQERAPAQKSVGVLLHDFESGLAALAAGGKAFGYELRPVPQKISPLLLATQRNWKNYRNLVESDFLRAPRLPPAATTRLTDSAARVLADAEVLVGALTIEIQAAQEHALAKMYVLLLVDIGVLILVFAAVRRKIVHPLRKLAEHSQALAHGRYIATLKIDSNDEIGQLAAVFSHSARQIGDLFSRIEQEKNNLQQAESMFRGLAENSVVGVYIAQDGGFRFVNPKMAQMFGYTREEMVASARIFDIVPDDEREMVETNIRKRIDGEIDAINYRRKARRKDGQLFDVEVFGSKMEIDGGTATIGVMLDITERKRVDRALRALIACNRALAHAASESDLLERACRMMHEICGYAFVRASCIVAAEPRIMHPVAQAGGTPGVLAAAIAAGASEDAQDVMAAALRSGETVVLQDIPATPGSVWHKFMTKHRIVAAIALPLRDGKKLLGALAIYSQDSGVFTPDELAIAEELADNLSYGMAALRVDAARMQYAQMLEYHAHHDVLTGLANRHRLSACLKQAIASARATGLRVAVLLLDLDRFKVINDTLGHAIGDELLQGVAVRLRACVRVTDTVARLGGDEFVVVISDVGAEDDVSLVACKILDALAQPVFIANQDLYIGASIGISLYPEDGADEEILLKNVDMAMYRAKQNGRANYHFFTEEIRIHNRERHAMESELHQALSRDELVLYYQPKVSLRTREIVGVEALVRWRHREHGLVSPYKFISVAEETGLILPLGKWILHAACVQGRLWQAAGARPVNIAINLSARQFRHHDLVGLVRQTILDTGIDPTLLDLEITESVIMQDAQEAVATMLELKKLGVRISLDDFGTGYSSLNYLSKFPLDSLKIDRLFVEGIGSSSQDTAIVKAVIALAHTLNLNVIAEGVENQEQLDFLEAHECDEIQGFYFSRPVPGNNIPALLAEGAFSKH